MFLHFFPIISLLLALAIVHVDSFNPSNRGFASRTVNAKKVESFSRFQMITTPFDISLAVPIFKASMQLADTSISEEEVLSVAGQTNNLPDPLIAVGFAFVVFLGVAVLQFSLNF